MNRRVILRYLTAIGIVIYMISVNGCIGYRLGSTLPEGVKSVYVPIFENKTSEPVIESIITAVTIQEIQKDGALKIAEELTADTILKVTITNYELISLQYDPNHSKKTSEFRLQLKVFIEFKRKNGETLVDGMITGEAEFSPSGDMTSAKRAALPKAARDLAHRIVERVVEYW